MFCCVPSCSAPRRQKAQDPQPHNKPACLVRRMGPNKGVKRAETEKARQREVDNAGQSQALKKATETAKQSAVCEAVVRTLQSHPELAEDVLKYAKNRVLEQKLSIRGDAFPRTSLWCCIVIGYMKYVGVGRNEYTYWIIG